jgi:hypothetical protein
MTLERMSKHSIIKFAKSARQGKQSYRFAFGGSTRGGQSQNIEHPGRGRVILVTGVAASGRAVGRWRERLFSTEARSAQNFEYLQRYFPCAGIWLRKPLPSEPRHPERRVHVSCECRVEGPLPVHRTSTCHGPLFGRPKSNWPCIQPTTSQAAEKLGAGCLVSGYDLGRADYLHLKSTALAAAHGMQGLKPALYVNYSARLKSCPDTRFSL